MAIYTKVCGLIHEENLCMVVEAGVDAIGLNFYPKSKRFVSKDVALQLRKKIPAGVDAVGVFVNSPPEEVVEIATAVKLDVIQFHGDESVNQIRGVQDLCSTTKIFRAFRLSHDNLDQTIAEVSRLIAGGVLLSAVLVDAFVEGEFGGTGHRLDQELIQKLPVDWPPLIVAGGLTPDNVGHCVQAVKPWGVDVASGVESAPGMKSTDKTKQFVLAARQTR